MASALELKGVSAGYGETMVLEDVSVTLAPGESISIIGRNGVGKTTLLATVMGHTTLHKGDVTLAGGSIARVPVHRRALMGLGFVPQEREIFPSLTVRENLEVGARPGTWTQERIFELFPNLKARQVMDRLKATALHPGNVSGKDNKVGFGMVNPVAALTAVLPAESAGFQPPQPKEMDTTVTPPPGLDWPPIIVALSGIGVGGALLMLTLFVRNSLNRKRTRQA